MAKETLKRRIEKTQKLMYDKLIWHIDDRADFQHRWTKKVGPERALSRLFEAGRKGHGHPSSKRKPSFFESEDSAFVQKISDHPSARRGRELMAGGPPVKRTRPDASIRTISDRRRPDFYEKVFGDDPGGEYDGDAEHNSGPDIEYLE